MSSPVYFTPHEQGPQPEETKGRMVYVFWGIEQEIGGPIEADECDWNHPGDPIEAYALSDLNVVRTSVLVSPTRKSHPASVGADDA